jgi:DNA processing protein
VYLDNISPVLLCQGQLALLSSDGVAIVGSRNVSTQGLEAARMLATDLANLGKNIISGYAKGVDTEAHRSALEAEGTTTIVLSYGIEEFQKKRDLQDIRWSQQDILVISQFAPDTKWNAGNAMARNKTVCALSNGVVVIESGKERDEDGKMSGTFDAAKIALELGIPLFIVSPTYFETPPAGNADLIRLGGIEITPSTGAEEIVKFKPDKDTLDKRVQKYKDVMSEQLEFFPT